MSLNPFFIRDAGAPSRPVLLRRSRVRSSLNPFFIRDAGAPNEQALAGLATGILSLNPFFIRDAGAPAWRFRTEKIARFDAVIVATGKPGGPSRLLAGGPAFPA